MVSFSCFSAIWFGFWDHARGCTLARPSIFLLATIKVLHHWKGLTVMLALATDGTCSDLLILSCNCASLPMEKMKWLITFHCTSGSSSFEYAGGIKSLSWWHSLLLVSNSLPKNWSWRPPAKEHWRCWVIPTNQFLMNQLFKIGGKLISGQWHVGFHKRTGG